MTLQAVSSARAIDLGSFTDLAASTLEISNLELSRISTPTLRIGSTAMTGDLTVSQEITADGHYDTLSLRTGGIVDGVAGPSTQITVDNLALRPRPASATRTSSGSRCRISPSATPGPVTSTSSTLRA